MNRISDVLTVAGIACIGILHAEPIGWASENGGTTGGAGGKTVTVGSASELMNNAKNGEAMVIRVSGKITADRVTVASNKTIEGAAEGAIIDGSIIMNGVENVIVRNLVFAKTSGSFEDIIQMQRATNIWIDHCDVTDRRSSLDGLCDMTHACDYITVSWTKFSYPNTSADHRLCMLISHSDNNEAEDLGKLKITLHHNWWAENIQERMPRMRFCQVHSFNNYFSSKGNNYCIGAGRKAQVLVESNYFDNVNRPHYFFADESTAIIEVNDDNFYRDCTGDRDEGQGTCFSPPYRYEPDRGSEVKDIVMNGAGPQFEPLGMQRPEPVRYNAAAPDGKAPSGRNRYTVAGRRTPVDGGTRALSSGIVVGKAVHQGIFIRRSGRPR